jgi:hypothetical protein
MWLVALAAVAIVIISELTGFYWIGAVLGAVCFILCAIEIAQLAAERWRMAREMKAYFSRSDAPTTAELEAEMSKELGR